MEPTLTIAYDPLSDTLFIDKVPPYPEQDSDYLSDTVRACFNPTSGEIEALEIEHFRRHLDQGERLRLPVSAILRAAVAD